MIFAYGILTTIEEVETVFETELDDAFAHIEAAGYSYAQNGDNIFIYDSIFAEEYNDDNDQKKAYHKFDADLFDYEENYKNLMEYSEMFDRDIELVSFEKDDDYEEDVQDYLESLNTIDQMLDETELSDSEKSEDDELENVDNDNDNDDNDPDDK